MLTVFVQAFHFAWLIAEAVVAGVGEINDLLS
jgi:hypothetical protein